MEEGQVYGEEMVVTNENAAELTKPGVGTFDLPASFVAPQFASMLVLTHLVVLPIGSISSMPRRFHRSRSGSES